MKKSVRFLLHSGYWILYFLLISSFLVVLGANAKYAIADTWKIIAIESPLLLMTFFPAVVCFYLFYTILFSRWLMQRKLPAFFIGTFAAAIISGALPILLLYLPGIPWKITTQWDKILVIWGALSVLALIHGAIGLVLRGFITWYDEIKLKEELKKKNLEIELALIKSQLNPHFLFNTINNIDVLIEQDPVRASDYLNKLSSLLRFLLYESQPPLIALEKELNYIDQYLDLQRIRTANADFIRYHLTGSPSGRTICPLLFISYIENAFKHGEQLKARSPIIVTIAIEEKSIHFFCKNSYSNEPMNKKDHAGLGNELLRKRLELVYPEKHELRISNIDNTYSVELRIFDHDH
jgi:sensor histidine kinase YesM